MTFEKAFQTLGCVVVAQTEESYVLWAMPTNLVGAAARLRTDLSEVIGHVVDVRAVYNPETHSAHLHVLK